MKSTPHRTLLSAVVGATLLASMAPALADGVKLFKEGDVPSAEDVSNMLKPKVKTRAIVIGQQPQQQQPQTEGFAFPINFPSGSANISPKSLPYCDVVGKALQMDASVKIIVEGHTDAKGADDMNMRLSERRAEAVKQYLVAHYGVGSERITAIGKGKTELYNKTNPEAAENRRVQFRRAD